jgi:hypothetical protein
MVGEGTVVEQMLAILGPKLQVDLPGRCLDCIALVTDERQRGKVSRNAAAVWTGLDRKRRGANDRCGGD